MTYDRNHYYILNLVPIRTDDALNSVYQIHPIPQFDHNSTYFPIIAHDYFAVSVHDDFMTPLTSAEISACVFSAMCEASSPSYEASFPKCGLSNFFDNVDVCVYEKREGLIPFFITLENYTFYSSKLPRYITWIHI